jgi:hypothetical protein
MPHNALRSSSRGRPGRSLRRGTTTGNSGWIRAHSWSGTIHGGCCPFLTIVINTLDDQLISRSIMSGFSKCTLFLDECYVDLRPIDGREKMRVDCDLGSSIVRPGGSICVTSLRPCDHEVFR